MSGHSCGGIATIVAATVLGSPLPPSSPVTEMAAVRGAIAADTTCRQVITCCGAMKNPVPVVPPA